MFYPYDDNAVARALAKASGEPEPPIYQFPVWFVVLVCACYVAGGLFAWWWF